MSIIQRALEKLGDRGTDRVDGEKPAPDGDGKGTGASLDVNRGGEHLTAGAPSGTTGRDRGEPTHRVPGQGVMVPGEGPAGQTHQLTTTAFQVDRKRLRELGLMVPGDPTNPLTEQYRFIKHALLLNIRDAEVQGEQGANLIMVTSSLPGEGKTFTALNLATSLAAELDRTVMLVDTDVYRGAVAQRLGLSQTTGLTDVLLNDAVGVEDVLVRTSLGYSVLPSGQHHMQLAELMASEKMAALARELAGRYSNRVVLFDSPPLLAASGAAILAGLVGQIVLVVEAGRTPKSVVQEAVDMLDPAKAIGCILNKGSHSSARRSYYGYYDRSAKKE